MVLGSRFENGIQVLVNASILLFKGQSTSLLVEFERGIVFREVLHNAFYSQRPGLYGLLAA